MLNFFHGVRYLSSCQNYCPDLWEWGHVYLKQSPDQSPQREFRGLKETLFEGKFEEDHTGLSYRPLSHVGKKPIHGNAFLGTFRSLQGMNGSTMVRTCFVDFLELGNQQKKDFTLMETQNKSYAITCSGFSWTPSGSNWNRGQCGRHGLKDILGRRLDRVETFDDGGQNKTFPITGIGGIRFLIGHFAETRGGLRQTPHILEIVLPL